MKDIDSGWWAQQRTADEQGKRFTYYWHCGLATATEWSTAGLATK